MSARRRDSVIHCENYVLDVWAVRLDADGAALCRCAAGLSIDERERAARFRFTTDRNRFVVARAALRTLLGRYVRAAPSTLRFSYDDYGKPMLAEPSVDLLFNVAHSGDIAVYVIGGHDPVGIDVEVSQTCEIDEIEALANRFFSLGEKTSVLSVAKAAQRRAFYNCWTRKEAYLKALGVGLAGPLDKFEVTVEADQPPALRRIDGADDEVARWSMFSFEPVDGAIAAVAVRRRPATMRFRGTHRIVDLQDDKWWAGVEYRRCPAGHEESQHECQDGAPLPS
jgi:4'-phosphopantetheinyl transferase